MPNFSCIKVVIERNGMLIGDKILSNIEIGKTIKQANFTLFLLAYTFGKTSPKSRIKNVTKSTSNTNFRTVESIAEKIEFREKENKITIPMLMKLLATNTVANNFFGFERSSFMLLALELLFLLNSSKSV